MAFDIEHWVLLTLVLLLVKHWYVDFVNQTMDEVHGKGIYGNWQGLKHSLKHGAATFVVFFLAGVTWPEMLLMASVDFVAHYHIDWVKMNYGNRDIQNPLFWNHLGADQLAHQVVYIVMVYYLTL